ncbi:MAG: prepilin-type N-terminal cleavage/methylation domain-containing protein [Campylobacterota bacterium]|nr:prepilin-type N-terminal cleavage/methylation domain-containing protein [Campylobacterota bacterium]
MKSGFTLIELLVVLLLMTVVLSVTVPMGSKIFSQFQNYVKKSEDKHALNQERAYAFIEAKKRYFLLEDNNYSISVKGILSK